MNVQRMQEDASWGDADDVETTEYDDQAGDPDTGDLYDVDDPYAPRFLDADLDLLGGTDPDLGRYNDFDAPRRRSWLLPVAVVGVGVVGLAALVGVVFGSAFVDDASGWVRSLELVAPLPAEFAPLPADAEPLAPAVPVVDASGAEVAAAFAPPAAEPEPEPAEVLPTPTATEAAPQPPGPEVARVAELTVSAEGASRLTVKCGGVSATGTSSVQLAAFPAGLCTVEAQWADGTYRMGTGVEEPKSLQCTLVEDVLRCS